MTKSKPWRIEVGTIAGLAIGLLVWWSAYDPASGLLQEPQLVVVPAAVAILVVSLRNRWKKVGPYDSEIIELNKRGVV